MNHVTSDKSLELVPWSDSLFVGLYTYKYVLSITHVFGYRLRDLVFRSSA